MKKIGIIGSGVVAKSLATGFIKHGYQVKLGTRDTAKLSDWLIKAGPNASVSSFSEVAEYGDIIVLAVKGSKAKEALHLSGPAHISGKTIIDTTNPIADTPPVHGVLPYFTTMDSSLMEQLQSEFSDAHFVKAFNSIGNAFMVNPEFSGGKPTMFICGNNDAAKAEVTAILDQFGHETEDVGKVEAARAIEPLCMLWCIPGILHGQWSHAFKLMKK